MSSSGTPALAAYHRLDFPLRPSTLTFHIVELKHRWRRGITCARYPTPMIQNRGCEAALQVPVSQSARVTTWIAPYHTTTTVDTDDLATQTRLAGVVRRRSLCQTTKRRCTRTRTTGTSCISFPVEDLVLQQEWCDQCEEKKNAAQTLPSAGRRSVTKRL